MIHNIITYCTRWELFVFRTLIFHSTVTGLQHHHGAEIV